MRRPWKRLGALASKGDQVISYSTRPAVASASIVLFLSEHKYSTTVDLGAGMAILRFFARGSEGKRWRLGTKSCSGLLPRRWFVSSRVSCSCRLPEEQDIPKPGAASNEIDRRFEAQQQQINDLLRVVEAQRLALEKLSSPAAPVASAAVTPSEIERRLEAQQQQINDLFKVVEAQRSMLEKLSAPTTMVVAADVLPPNEIDRRLEAEQQQINDRLKVVEAQRLLLEKTPVEKTPLPTTPVVAASAAPVLQDSAPIKAPLSLEIGGATFTPTGFLDFSQVWRSSVVTSGLPTSFAGIPFSDSVFGTRRQTLSSAANSRVGLQVDTRVLGAKVLGVVETDFLGFQPGNLTTTTNAYGMRLRLAFADITKGKWEFLGGQDWSLLTPGRTGISPLPGNLFLTQNLDPNLQSGLVWARNPQIRAVYHPTASVSVGVSFESADTYAGGSAGAGAITLPAGFTPDYFGQLNTGSGGIAVPNPNSDFIAKIAFDPKIGGRSIHIEIGGLLDRYIFFNPTVSKSFSTTGGAGQINGVFEVFKNFSLYTNNFYSDGGGRYIFGEAPSLIIKADGSPSLVHAMSTVDGLEYQLNEKLKLYSYYGGTYVSKNVTIDPSTGLPVGYGFIGSPSGQNRTIQEVTGGFSYALWKNPNYGTFQLNSQYSFVVRHVWFVPPGQPGSANLNMIYVSLRYVLPGSAPKLK